MDARVAIWNTLHDGEITVFSRNPDASITVFVNIPYLRTRLDPIGDSFVLTLTGVRRADFIDPDGNMKSIQEEVSEVDVEILGTKSESMPVTVVTSMGQLALDFDSINIALDTGQEVTYEAMWKACEDYWREWESRIKK